MPTPSPARIHEFSVVANEPIARNCMSLTIKAPKLAEALKPGQFVSLAVPGNAMSLLRIPLSFASTNAVAGTVEMWYAIVGEGTERLSKMQPGETSTVLGPGGHGWEKTLSAPTCLAVAGGIGMPPIYALAMARAAAGLTTDVIVGAATAASLTGVDDLDSVEGISVMIATDDGTAGHDGFCTDLVQDALATHSYDSVATCGPEPMMSKVAQMASDADVLCEASLERMMSCGFGACATCAVETVNGMKGACMCGPVFDAKEVVW